MKKSNFFIKKSLALIKGLFSYFGKYLGTNTKYLGRNTKYLGRNTKYPSDIRILVKSYININGR